MKPFIFSCVFLICTLSCQDIKNERPLNTNPQQNIDTFVNNASQGLKDTLSQKTDTAQTHPKITPENVVAFLTAYGAANKDNKVRIETRFGNIDILLFEDTPLHRANFIYLVKQGYFTNTFFHRVVPNFIIQGGNSDTKDTPKKRKALAEKYRLPAEINLQRKHTYGTVSGAKEYRKNPDKKSAPFEFFIFLGPDKNAAHLNGNYTIFGRVIAGMDVVETIANLPSDKGEWPKENVYLKVYTLPQ